MTPFEEELKRALARRTPSPDFTQRLLAKLESPKQVPRRWFAWRLAAAAATLLIAGGAAYQQHERQVQGQAAKRKLLLALRITGSKLQETQQRVHQVEDRQIENPEASQ